ncbi:MAG TPA: hypothetical protein PLR18_03310 [bacterium]|nr:hypothetical protein [bacterium]
MKKILTRSLVHSLGVVIYILLVTGLMSKANDWFGKEDTALSGAAFLLLFVLSATVVGSLVLGKPILLYWDGEKKNALKMLFYTSGWLFVWLVLCFVVIALI